MYGSIIGDIVGSRFEWNNHRSKDFELFTEDCFFTDDTIMSLAICSAFRNSEKLTPNELQARIIERMQTFGRYYPDGGYGTGFQRWLHSENPKPYNSFGNGAAMRVGACAYVANNLEQAIELSKLVTEVTHNHPEGIKGAEATTVAIYMAKSGSTLEEIEKHINNNYYKIDFTLDSIREDYEFNETCQGTVPQAMQAFFESTSFEDAIRNAISIGGDSDTLAAITGSVAEAYYGIPYELEVKTRHYLDTHLLKSLDAFRRTFMNEL